MDTQHPWGSNAYTVARFGNEYALALILPRHWPGHVSDADIEATTRHVVATEFLPWEIEIPADFGCYRWSEQ
jgi:hypothetical protein